MIITSHKIAQPADGETRIIRRWAWWHRVGDKIVVMGRYSVLQCYVYNIYQLMIDGQKQGFRVGKWVDISENINSK